MLIPATRVFVGGGPAAATPGAEAPSTPSNRTAVVPRTRERRTGVRMTGTSTRSGGHCAPEHWGYDPLDAGCQATPCMRTTLLARHGESRCPDAPLPAPAGGPASARVWTDGQPASPVRASRRRVR